MKKDFLFAAGCAVLICGCSVPEISREYAASDYAMPQPAMMPPTNVKMMNRSAGALSDGKYFAKSDRAMAYTAGFTVNVKSREVGLAEIKKIAESLKGYLVSSRRGTMKLKVPVAKADEFLKLAQGCGKVSDFYISADDLTDTITDLNVRLDNLRKLRVRLTELLAKAQKVDDMLKIERELNRVTTEIERLTANLKNNQDRVDYVNFTVEVIEEKGAMPGGNPQAVERFSFLKDLASDAAGDESSPLFGIDAPQGFVAMQSSYGKYTEGFAATSSDDCIFRTWEVDIADESTLDFWQKMVCRALESKKSFDKIKTEKVTFKGQAAIKITAEVNTKRGLQSYMAVISINECWGCDELRIVEFFGPQEAYKKHEKAVLNTLAE